MNAYPCRRTPRFDWECLKQSPKQVGTCAHFMPILRHYSTLWLAISIYKIQPTNKLVIFALFENAVEICLLSFFSTLIYQHIYLWHPCLFVFSICIYNVIALLNNCPMHGEFPSGAWLKINAREKIIFKGEKYVF